MISDGSTEKYKNYDRVLRNTCENVPQNIAPCRTVNQLTLSHYSPIFIFD